MIRTLAKFSDRTGVASIEAALLGSLVLVPLLGGTTDAAILLCTWSQVSRAQQAGLLSAWGNGASATTIAGAATAAYGNSLVHPTIQASVACYCLPPATSWSRGSTNPSPCTAPCGSGTALTEFATVSVTATVALPMPLPLTGLSSPFTIASSATARLL